MSRQLDAWVAEYVMGFKKVCMTPGEGYGCTLDNEIAPLKSYSTDMNAAMEVANILDFYPGIYQWESDTGLMWGVDLGKYSAEHLDLPTAICLAALRAVGKDDLVDEYLGGDK